MTKTLYISVCDTLKVSDNKRKEKFELVRDVLVFSKYVPNVLEELFANVNNFCRPPTVININRLIQKNHLAF